MSKSQSKYILVTGGAGYIGSHTCKLLKSQGYEPVTFDNLSNGHKHAVKWGPLLEGDLRDVNSINSAFEEYDFAAVIHFASFIEVGESISDPAKYYINNVSGTLNLLNAMLRNDVTAIVFSSSCAVYGPPNAIPITEKNLTNPINPYGQSKLMVENILSDFSEAYNFRYVACRYFNACGADPELQIGEEHKPETHIIPLALMAASGERDGFNIYGTDYETDDGTCIRDYIHVQDLARAHISALRYLENKGESTAVNLGTGNGYSVMQILDAIKNITRQDFVINCEQRRAGDPPELVADSTKARDLLDFKTEMSDLDAIINTAWKFYLKKNRSR